MKRRFLIFLLGVLSVVCLCIGLTACGGDDSDSGNSGSTSDESSASDSSDSKENVTITDENGIEYTLSDDGTYYSVTGYSGENSVVEIPSTYEGVAVTLIGENAFKDNSIITSVSIPYGVTSIGKNAFCNCGLLESVTIGYGVTTIGDAAFHYCVSLKEISLPNTLTSIGNTAFSECTSLENVTLGNKVSTLGYHAFSYCTSLKTVTLGYSVTSIGNMAFHDCTSLEGVYITNLSAFCHIYYDYLTNNPLYYAGNLYVNNTLLTDLAETDLTYIGSYTLSGWNVTDITIPASVTKIGDYAFSYSATIENLTIKKSSIGSAAFVNCTSLKTVTIENGSIGNNAFYGCSSLESFTIGSSVTSVTASAFRFCSSLTSFSVDSGNRYYKAIDGNLYSYNGKEIVKYAPGKTDTSFSIPDSVTTIGDYAFYECTSLTSITIPDSVTSIGSSAFTGCYKLVEVNNLSSLDLTIGSTDNGYVAYYAIVVYSTSEGSRLISQDDYLFIGDDEGNYYLVSYNGSQSDITLPYLLVEGNSVNYSINQYAFYCCDTLTSVTIPDCVTSIDNFAFESCILLTSITIGDSVTSIGSYAFLDCSRLESVTIPDSATSIGYEAFYGCTALESITFENTSGWYVTRTNGATSGTDIDVTDISENVTQLTSTYTYYYWYRSES